MTIRRIVATTLLATTVFTGGVSTAYAAPADRGDSGQASGTCDYTNSRPTLRRTDVGDAVRQAQCLMGIAIDGKFGPETEATVLYLQSNSGLPADGVIGPRTWEVLYS